MTSKFIALPLALLSAAAWAAPAIPITGQGFYVKAYDPRHPKHLAWEMWGREGTSIGNTVHATGVKAFFYEKGQRSAKLTSDEADGDSAARQVTAHGRAQVQMLDKTGSTLRAHTITWYTGPNLMVASGDVHYLNPKAGLAMTCATMTYDVSRKITHTGLPYASEMRRRAQ